MSMVMSSSLAEAKVGKSDCSGPSMTPKYRRAAATTETKPAPNPTDRSMPPVTITKTMPQAMMAMIAIWGRTFWMLSADQKVGVAIPNPIQMATRAMIRMLDLRFLVKSPSRMFRIFGMPTRLRSRRQSRGP